MGSFLTLLFFWVINKHFILSTGYALDPSIDTSQVSSNSYIGAVDEAEKNKGNFFIMASAYI